MPAKQGFTFIELMVTLVVLSLLASIAFPTATVIVQRQKEQELHADLVQIRKAIDDYKHAVEQGRIQQKLDDTGYPPNLDILVTGAIDQRSLVGQRLYFLRHLPIDPFSLDETLPPAQTWGIRSSSSPPDAPEEGVDVFDVYSKSSKTGLNGIAYRKW